jgi:hypothetical protein
VYVLKLPLFLDTVFTCAISFSAGFLPGLAAAVLSTIAVSLRDVSRITGTELLILIFVLCSSTEALLVSTVRTRLPKPDPFSAGPVPGKNPIPLSRINGFAILLLLYIAACISVSVLGGIIDFFIYEILRGNKLHFSPEDTFKAGFLRTTMPVLAANILSRIPINMADRFITIFGGFLVSRGFTAVLNRFP